MPVSLKQYDRIQKEAARSAHSFLNKKDLYQAIELVREILELDDTCYPLDPFKLAESPEDFLHVRKHAFESSKIGGMLIKNKLPAPSCLVINESRPLYCQRFDCAHELIHFFLHPADQEYVCESQSGSSLSIEYQANEGAAELLMPWRMFLPHFLAAGKSASCLNDLIFGLSGYFQLSHTVIRYRIQGLGYEIHQALEGTELSNIQILSRNRLQQMGQALPSPDRLFERIVEKLQIKRQSTIQYDYIPFEDELRQQGFYEAYYRGC